MDLQKSSLSPRNPQVSPYSASHRFISLTLVGSLLLALFAMGSYGRGSFHVMRLAPDIGGGVVFLSYLLKSNALILLILVAGVGAMALYQKRKWGWALSFGAALFTGFICIFKLILVSDSAYAWVLYPSMVHTLFLYLTFFLSIAMIVLLSIQPVRTAFQLGGKQYFIGLGIMSFLVLDILFCFFWL